MQIFRGNVLKMSRKTTRFFSTPLKTAGLANRGINPLKLASFGGLTVGLGFLYSTLNTNKDVMADDGKIFL